MKIPKTKHFPDGDYIRYWVQDGRIWAQMYTKKGKPVRGKFTYEGPEIPSWGAIDVS